MGAKAGEFLCLPERAAVGQWIRGRRRPFEGEGAVPRLRDHGHHIVGHDTVRHAAAPLALGRFRANSGDLPAFGAKHPGMNGRATDVAVDRIGQVNRAQ